MSTFPICLNFLGTWVPSYLLVKEGNHYASSMPLWGHISVLFGAIWSLHWPEFYSKLLFTISHKSILHFTTFPTLFWEREHRVPLTGTHQYLHCHDSPTFSIQFSPTPVTKLLLSLEHGSHSKHHSHFGPDKSLLGESCLVHCRIFTSIPGLYPIDTNNTLFPKSSQSKLSLSFVKCPWRRR